MRLRYVARKVGWSLLTLLFVLSANFFLFRILPGDPLALLARSQRLAPSALAKQRAIFGLDQPLPSQFVTYLHETLTGNLGVSIISGQDVASLVASRIWPTVLLVGIGTGLAAVIGVLVGIRGGWNRGSGFDRGTLYGSLVLYSAPEAWLGMLLLIAFAGTLGWFPAGGYSSGTTTGLGQVADVANHLVLPVVTLALGYVGQFVIVMRSSMLEVKEAPYVEVARAKGLSERAVRRGHVVPNAFLPSFTLIVLSVGFILGGAIVIETVFSWPGLGLLTYQAIQDQDYPVLEAVFLLSSAAVVLANLVADLAYGYLDPRIDEV
ncbi:MAG TPA: ABC transporter permease [Candidatus Nanopelagicales bacterium]|jgi:peptide/nickel transport system permease protein